MKPLAIRVAVSLAVAVAIPLVQVMLACRNPVSEACVWGKAYLPISVALSAILLTPIIATALWVIGVFANRQR